MPYMDDISFFESSAFQHRGGIWSDATRHEKVPIVVEPISESVSAPELPLPTIVSSNEDAPPHPGSSQSTEELRLRASPMEAPEPAPVFDSPANMPPPDEPGRARTRSWFSSVGSNDAAALLMAATPDESADDGLKRGRTIQVETPTSGRSRSTPNHPELPGGGEGGDPQLTLTNNLPQNSRRSSLHHVHSLSLRERFESPSSTTSGSSSTNTPSPARTPESFWNSPGSNQSSSSTSSFLSTLKSRAGDKQALSNSAKEAMRKLGVSWGGLRKDTTSGNAMIDDIPDQGSVDPRRRADSTNSFSQRARASYAEVRAAVVERKVRDRLGQGGEEGMTPSIPMPDSVQGQERSSQSSNNSIGGGLPFSSTAPSMPMSRPPSDSPEVIGTSPRYLSPAVSRSNTEQSQNRGSEGQDPSVPKVNGPPPSPTLVHSQPMQARVMSIPGIHPSHRGDIMSMGYVAPTPPENKPKAAAIQSVYRLWKSPTLSNEQLPEADTSLQSDLISDDNDVLPPTLSPSLQSTSTPPRPPPLPPRSTPASISRPALDDPRLSSESPEGISSASEALKSIASKDEDKRASLELHRRTSGESVPDIEEDRSSLANLSSMSNSDSGLSMSSTLSPAQPSTNVAPPLPPRRTQTTA
jgi:hypothetical protein